MRIHSLLLAGIAAAAGCATVSEPPAGQAASAPPLKSGLDLAGFDRSVRPQDDLYRFTNGQWLADTNIPADKSNYGIFGILDDDAQQKVFALVKEAAGNEAATPGSSQRKIGDFFASFMDTSTVEAAGLRPLAPELAAISALEHPDDVFAYFGRAQRLGGAAPIVFFVSPDGGDATRYVGSLYQAGLTMPDRDYYLVDDDKNRGYRQAFVHYASAMLAAADVPDADGAAARILALETDIARAQWSRVQNRDPVATYNKLSRSEAAAAAPQFGWQPFLAAIGTDTGAIDVNQPTYVASLGVLVRERPIATWREYLAFQLIDSYAPYLASKFDELHFDFHSRSLRGVQEQQERWKRGVDMLGNNVGEMVGQMYVERHFSPASKARMQALVGNLLQAFAQSIDGLQWMGSDTRTAAHEKLGKFTVKIGYPDKWRDYSSLTISRDDLVGNIERATAFEFDRQLKRVGGPVDRSEWLMTPYTVNAYYYPPANEIVFPAAILQPPFFDPQADDAVNYGAIGAVIGHEISHGFDDSGRQFDGDGNLRDWWTAADADAFKQRAARLVTQYGDFTVLDDEKVNGELTLGENIGDLSGLAVAYKAYLLSLAGTDPPVIDGFTGPQRFFLGWSQAWRRKYRDDELRRRLKIDPHSPSEYRANGTVSNIQAFYDAFGLRSGDRLFRPESERVTIW
ncbi:MAG: M13 family metallopeptidase [Steroidobacteraceae bacterium]